MTLSNVDVSREGAAGTNPDSASPAPSLGSRVAAILQARRKIAEFFDPALFADPAYDILLALFSAHEEGETASVSDACLAANVPSTTALRWIGILEQRGLIARTPDPFDRRRSYVSITPFAHEQMQKWLVALSPGTLNRIVSAAPDPRRGGDT